MMTNTVLQCSDYRCTRTNVESFRDDRAWNDRERGPKATLQNIICRIHAGALKRTTYRDNPLPLTPKDVKRLLAEQAIVDDQWRAEQAQRAIEHEARDVERHAEEWAYTENEAGHALRLRLEKDTWRTEDEREPVYTGHVWTGDVEPNDRWDNRWFQIEPSVRNYGAKTKRKYPYYVRVTRGASLTSNEARALAAVLLEGADKTDELNVERKP